MWLFVFFDLPTTSPKERKAYSIFRKKLQNDGFVMMQYSVYTRHCASWQSGQVHMKRVESIIPSKGQVSILQITDKQYGDIINYWGKASKALSPQPQQLEMF